MYFVDPQRYSRASLSLEHREFLLRVVPLAGFVQQQTYNKALVTNKQTHSGVLASVLAAHLIHKSNFGDHSLAQISYNGAAANNLAMLKAHKYWHKITIEHEGTKYRGYKNWREFGIDFSDTLAFQNGFEDLLACKDAIDQIEALSEREKNLTYIDTIQKLIRDLGLKEFDWYAA